MNSSDRRARLEALLQRVVSRKDVPRPVRVPAPTAAPGSVLRAPTATTAFTPSGGAMAAEASRTTASMAHAVGKSSRLPAPTPLPTAPSAVRDAAREPLATSASALPLQGWEPSPEPPVEGYDPDPAAPEISEAADVSVEIPVGSLDLMEPDLGRGLSELREPEPELPPSVRRAFDEPRLRPEEQATLPSPGDELEKKASAPEPVVRQPSQEPKVSSPTPAIEPVATQRFDPKPLPEPQTARVVAMPAVAPTPLRELVRRSIALRVRRLRPS